MMSFQFLFISVLFPFTLPFFEKLNVSFFPAQVLDFFYSFLKQIKSDRNESQHKVRAYSVQLQWIW